ncbi:toprim domain-containing protein [Rubrivivax gelatinosus]|uniref:toprim domain-containing protein n=1 Tax=Rubrivivax gelatinosus TaxID=28068 RepID=UPI0005C224E1|nr:toprim domain-containing protein [Rubrivivax gelatinosus]MBG6083017.1 hypothetical protein [Rubrivivax gelatinosus]
MSTMKRGNTVDFATVRAKVPLTWFFEHMLGASEPTLRSQGTLRYNVCPNPDCGLASKASTKCSVSRDRWNCFACGKKGDVVEAAMHHWGTSLKDAALRLIGADEEVLCSYKAPVAPPKVDRDDAVLHKVIAQLVDAQRDVATGAIEYLASRGIDPKLTREAVRRKLLVTLPEDPEACKEHLLGVCGRDALATAGLWRHDAKAPAAAFRPLMFVSYGMTSVEFRLMRKPKPGDIKSLRYGAIAPFVWINECQDRVMIVEGAIDLLSALQMGTKRSLIGVPGCENWREEWFTKLAGRDVLDGLDGDGPGVQASEKLRPVLEGKGAKYHRYLHPHGAVDLNDELMLRRQNRH